MQELVKLEDITKSFNDKIVLDKITLSVEPAMISALIGVNGAGKSTICKIIMDLYKAEAGRLTILGQSTGNLLQVARSQIAYLGNDCLIPALTVRQNFNLARQLLNRDDDLWSELASYFDLIAQLDTTVQKLSKGLKQRVLLVITLMQDKALYILDEPFINLDAINTHKLKELISKKCLDKQESFIICSHNFYLLQELADKFFILQNGKITNTLSKGELEQLRQTNFKLATTNNRQALALLEQMPEVHNVHLDNQAEIVFSCPENKLDYIKLNQLLYKHDLYICKLKQDDLNLEQYVYELYKGN